MRAAGSGLGVWIGSAGARFAMSTAGASTTTNSASSRAPTDPRPTGVGVSGASTTGGRSEAAAFPSFKIPATAAKVRANHLIGA